ncbi:MAG: hydrogen peroxide-inducible genes activator [Tannerella sp.]|jgi:LysR family hydrogen peroxide-inducible transcriptional activator|nr:hydrogen peroxide-inducible genes activator [Tannerella sp.]
MNIQQLEYIIAVDKYRHFAKAADDCRITQPTLSMMIQKLEEELDVKIFDRTKHPVEPTVVGKQIIDQAHVSLKHFRQIKYLVENEQQTTKGCFALGIIPTIATYLVPVLLSRQDETDIELTLKEYTTTDLIDRILKGELDGGLLAGPLNHPELAEYPVYYEKFYAYVSPQDRRSSEKEIDLSEIDINDIWLLENVHCLRGQIERLCRMKKKASAGNASVKYESGSIDTLIHIVDYNQGITIIPELHAMGLSEEKQENLRAFKNSTAVREVSLIVSRDYVRKSMLNVILKLVKSVVPRSMQDPALKDFVVDL